MRTQVETHDVHCGSVRLEPAARRRQRQALYRHVQRQSGDPCCEINFTKQPITAAARCFISVSPASYRSLVCLLLPFGCFCGIVWSSNPSFLKTRGDNSEPLVEDIGGEHRQHPKGGRAYSKVWLKHLRSAFTIAPLSKSIARQSAAAQNNFFSGSSATDRLTIALAYYGNELERSGPRHIVRV